MPQGRQLQLDSLRALGLIVVVFVHTMNPKGPFFSDIGPTALALFFVLSGYLITGILLDAREKAIARQVGRGGVLKNFYIRRFLRIFPIYYGVIALAMLLGEPTTQQYFWHLVTYRSNFLLAAVGHNLPPITPFWSLAVEEHFYAVWPLIALFATRRVQWISIAVMVFGSMLSRFLLVLSGAPYNTITLPTYSSLDGIALGCALALMWREMTEAQRAPWLRRALFAGLAMMAVREFMLVVPVPHGYLFIHTAHTLPFALVCMWIIEQGAFDRLPKWLSWRWLAELGVMSYGAYIMHRYVMHYLGYDYERGLDVFGAVLGVSVALTIVSWKLYEGPINNLKRFFPYVKRPAPPTISTTSAVAETL